jgi:hypothetical protein
LYSSRSRCDGGNCSLKNARAPGLWQYEFGLERFASHTQTRAKTGQQIPAGKKA